MDFKKMLSHLKCGHKMRRPSWDGGAYLYLDGVIIRNKQSDKVKFDNIHSLEVEDYEIFEEDSLSDNIKHNSRLGHYYDWVYVRNVKKFIKELLCDICKKYPENNCSKCNRIKERAGPKLI